jgi:acyl-CoA thioester hydrolase
VPPHFSIQVQVRYAECDMQGHVFNGHYLTWFDMAHTALLANALAKPWSETLRSETFDVVVIESGVRYLAPAHFEDDLAIGVRLDPLTRTSMTSHYTVSRQDTLIAEGFLRHVCVSHGTTDKQPWPDEARRALQRYVPSDEPAPAAGESAGR